VLFSRQSVIQRPWWSAWLDDLTDPRVDLTADGPVYVSHYQPGYFRTVELGLRAPGEVRETEISFKHSATNVVFGHRHVSIRPLPPPPPGELVVTALDELKFTGPKGGPFTPSTARLRIQAKGTGFQWKITDKPAWLVFRC
jgi:hypothetical protein